jgi:predicted transcriptional regulator
MSVHKGSSGVARARRSTPIAEPERLHRETVVIERVNPAWLRWKRETAGVSLRSVARRLDLSAPYISDIERGNRACPDDVRFMYEAL